MSYVALATAFAAFAAFPPLSGVVIGARSVILISFARFIPTQTRRQDLTGRFLRSRWPCSPLGELAPRPSAFVPWGAAAANPARRLLDFRTPRARFIKTHKRAVAAEGRP